jgi:hypothetical protein
MSNNKTFTQEVKDKWIEALESGKFKQGYATLYNPDTKAHCCIGVLGAICPFLSNEAVDDDKSPYIFLDNNLGESITHQLWKANDSHGTHHSSRPQGYKDDYSNVIPLIKELKIN